MTDDYQTAQLLAIILELLTFCIEHQAYNIKNYTLSKDLIRRVLVLLKSHHSFLALGTYTGCLSHLRRFAVLIALASLYCLYLSAALRLFRKVVGLKDDFYNRYLIKNDLFKPVIEAFVRNGNKYNLLNSAMIELFEFMKSVCAQVPRLLSARPRSQCMFCFVLFGQEDIKSLIRYVIEKHYHAFDKVDYVQTFVTLKRRYEQSEDTSMHERPIDA